MRPYVSHMLCAKGAGTPPTPLTVSVTPSSGAAGSSGSQSFTASVSGATGAVTYSWSATASSGTATISSTTLSGSVSWSGLSTGGTVTVACTATDSLGATGTGVAVLTRSASPAMTNVIMSTSGSPYITGGVSYGVLVTASPVGGAAPFSYNFSVDNFDGAVQSGGSAVPFMNYVDGTRIKQGNVYCTVQDDNGTTIDRSIGLLSISY